MKGTPLEHFGKGASALHTFTEIAGRYRFQKQAEQRLLYYLLETLSLSPDDDLLEIGCGAGNLLVPFSFFVHSATGVDHPDLLSRLAKRLPKDRDTLTLLPGDFLTMNVQGTFSRILIYSVIQYLRDEAEVLAFIRKAALRLRPGGTMLIGDIPNKDMKARFMNSKRGKKFAAQWRKQVAREEKKTNYMNQLDPAIPLVAIDDALVKKIVAMLKRLRLRAKRVRQPDTLSFGYTREDIIIEKNGGK